MKVISANYILSMDENSTIYKDMAIAYDKKIIKIAKENELKREYPKAKFIKLPKNQILMPGLINTHIHLEYYKNKTTLKYGDFISWLKSVIKHQQEFIDSCDKEELKKILQDLIKSGTTTIGEISSFGLDIEACKESLINVILFNEVLGSAPNGVDAMYQNFLQRYQLCKSIEDERFIPAISVHSPYSTHPILAKKVLQIARDDDRIISTHFMESRAEREWIDKGEGDFVKFLQNFNPYAKPMISAKEYINLFNGTKALFTHATYATDEELKMIDEKFFITTCPLSNRLLENIRLDISKVENLALATDGLTSNISLNLWDEMRAFLSIHYDRELKNFSKQTLYMTTSKAGEALHLQKGIIKEDYDADMIVVKLAGEFDNIEDIYQWLILHTKEVEKTIILGEEV